jgi:hypothetical protein
MQPNRCCIAGVMPVTAAAKASVWAANATNLPKGTSTKTEQKQAQSTQHRSRWPN